MSGCSTSVPTEKAQDRRNHQDGLPECTNLPKTSEPFPLQPEIEVSSDNIKGDSNGNENVHEDEDEDEDADFNPFLKDTNLLDVSSSLSSEVEDLDADVSNSKGKLCAAFSGNSVERYTDVMHANGTIEHGEEMVMQCTVSPGELCGSKSNLMPSEKESLLVAQSENRSFGDKENDSTSLMNDSNAADGMKPQLSMDADGAICMRTRARYSLASFTLDELETFLQETDDEDDLQNVDDEEEYKKFLAAVLRGDESQNLQESTNDDDDDDEENDADFELELEEALESEPEEIEERRVTRRNRRQKASFENNKKPSGQLARPLRPLLPFASLGSIPTFDGKHLASDISSSFMPSVSNGFTCGFTPHQIGQLHCLIHEHVQLLIQVFSMCVLEPAKRHTAAQIKELIVELLRKRDQLLAWRTLPYPSFCFFPPYIHPSVPDELAKMLQPSYTNNNSQHDFPSGNSKDIHPDVTSSCNVRPEHPADEQASSSQTVECTSWGPYICGPVLSVTDVAPLRLVENFMDDVSSAVRGHEQCQIELGFDAHCQKEPLFPLHSSSCSVEADGQGEMENTPPNSTGMLSSSSNQLPKKTMAATLLEKAKNQPLALVPKEISKLALRFQSLFNPSLYPHKPPPAPLTNRVLFTDAEDELLALGLMEYNTDWKAIQQRFLPCKSRHQIFVRQKNRASSKAPENPIKAVRRMKNSSLTSEEVARIELGLKKYKLDWISIWRFFVPYRDPSLLPRQWRIACGTQKSYKSDANKKAKRRLYELRRKACKPSASTWHSSSEKEGDSTDNAVEDTNSGDNHMDKEDEAYVHEAFLADWRPDTNVSSSFSTCLHSDGSQAGEPNDNSVSAGIQPLVSSKSSAALRPSYSQVVLRPYRARRANNARMVKLAPGLPPVNLPPSVRIMSQSAFQSSQAVAAAKNPGNASRVGVGSGNLGIGSTMKPEAGSSVKSGPNGNCSVSGVTNRQHPNHSDVSIEKCASGRGDSDLQMHPLLFQTPQDGDLPYYPLNSCTSMSSSFTFFSGKQPQLSLSLFHNPRDIRDAVNFLSKSSKAPDKNASHGVDFHPLFQRTHDRGTNAVEMHPGAASPPFTAKSRQKHVSSQGPREAISKPDLNGSSSGAITKDASHNKNANELDLDIHLCFTSSHQESGKDGDMALHNTGKSLNALMSGTIESESTRDFADKRNSAPDGMNDELDSGEFAIITSQDKGSGQVSETIHDDSLPEIIMEQEELSDSEEEFGENVEFEQEEMADSDDSTSESEQLVNILNEVCEPVADIDDHQVANTQRNGHDKNTRGTSDGHLVGKGLVENVANVKHDADSMNLNSSPPNSRTEKPVVGYEFGLFGTTGGSLGLNQLQAISERSSSRLSKPGTTVDKQKRVADALEHHHLDGGDTLARNHPRKRVCQSYSNSSNGRSEKANLSSNNSMNVQNLKKKKNGNC